MELFLNNGHLSEEGLQAIVNGNLDEMQALEGAEHLSFCDQCLSHYTQLLENTPLLEPLHPMREPILKRIKRRTRSILFSKTVKIGSAACLAIALWRVGTFTGVSQMFSPKQELPKPPAHSLQQNTTLGDTLDGAAKYLNQFLTTMVNPAPKEKEEVLPQDKEASSASEQQPKPDSTSLPQQ